MRSIGSPEIFSSFPGPGSGARHKKTFVFRPSAITGPGPFPAGRFSMLAQVIFRGGACLKRNTATRPLRLAAQAAIHLPMEWGGKAIRLL